MAFIQKNLPPPIKTQSFVFNDFTGGLNNVTSDELLKDNETQDILNMTFNEEGTMDKRRGTVKYDNFNYNDSITFMDKFRTNTGDDKLIVCTNTELYVDKVKLCDVTKTISGITYLNNYYFVDSNSIRIYGKFPQVDSGEHIKIIGTPVVDYTLMTIVNPPVYTPLGASFTVGVWKYNYTSNIIWYEPCQQELDDTYKGTNLLPTNPSIICMHGNRLFLDGDLINPGNIFISDILNAFYFPVGLPIQLPPNGQAITGMKVFMDSVVAGRHDDLHVIYGNTNRTTLQDVFTLKKINAHTGFMNNNSISEAHNYLFYLGSDAVVYKMHTTQTDVNVLATSELSQKLDLFKYPIELDYDKMKNCCSVFDNDKFYLFHSTVTLVYSYKFMAWTLYKGVTVSCSIRLDNELFLGSIDNFIYISSEGYDDSGIPIVAYRSSKMFDFGYSSNYKQFKELYIIAHVFDGFLSDINIRYEIDYVDVMQISTIANQIGRWGKAKFGERFLTRNISPSLPITIGRRGRKLRIIIMSGEYIKETVPTFTDLEKILVPVYKSLYRTSDTGIFYRYAFGEFTIVPTDELYQPLRVYEINGEFTVKGKR